MMLQMHVDKSHAEIKPMRNWYIIIVYRHQGRCCGECTALNLCAYTDIGRGRIIASFIFSTKLVHIFTIHNIGTFEHVYNPCRSRHTTHPKWVNKGETNWHVVSGVHQEVRQFTS